MAAQDGLDGDAARRLDEAHRQLTGDQSIQFQLPSGGVSPADPSMGPSPRFGPSNGPPAQTPQPDPSSMAPPAPAPEPMVSGSGGVEGLMQVFLWVAAAIALAILVYWIFTFFRDRGLGEREPRVRRTRERAPEDETWRPGQGEAAQLLDEADILANAGRYDEAARLLLHRSIGEIDAHRPDLVRPALTSRDIARHPLLPTGPAAAFARIAALVERSLFACRPLGQDDWQDCRAAYREFAFADGWQG